MNQAVLVAVCGGSAGDQQRACDRLQERGFQVFLLEAAAGDRSIGGMAEQRGCSHAVTLDLDRGDDPAELERLLAPLARDPDLLVVGLARAPARAPGWFWPGVCLRLACGVEAAAAASSFRAYPTAVLTDIACTGRGPVVQIELLARAVWAGWRVETVQLSSPHEPASAPPAPGMEALSTCLRLCLRNLNPWPFRRHRSSDPDAVPFSLRRLGAWSWSVHRRATRKLGADEAGLSLRHPIRSLKNLHLERTAPEEIALASMLGVFLGALPLLFVHTVAIVFYATRLQLNRAVAFYASNLCAPFLPPFVPALDIEVGHYLLHGRFLSLADLGTREALFQTLCAEAHLRLFEYLIGSLVVGPLLALLVGGVVYAFFAYRNRRRAEAVSHG